MDYFSEQDLEAIQTLQYEPTIEPSFDSVKFCLIWADETPTNFSTEGYENLCDLWIARSFMFHRKLPESQWGLDPAYFRNVWNTAIERNLNWPGFKRLNLSQQDHDYLFKRIEEATASV